MASKSKKNTVSNEELVEEVLAHPMVAPHLLRGCEVMVCVETGSLSYSCTRLCTEEKSGKEPTCSPLQDAHISVKSIARKKSRFSKAEKEALLHFAPPWA